MLVWTTKLGTLSWKKCPSRWFFQILLGKIISHKMRSEFQKISKLIHDSSNQIHKNMLPISLTFQRISSFFSTNFTCGTTQFHVIGPFNSSNFMNFSNWFQYKCGPHWSWNCHLEQNLPCTFQGWIAMAHSAHRYNRINGSRFVHYMLNENIHDVFFLRNKVINFMKLIMTYNEIGQKCC
jgi:hypothetical protein